MITVQLPDGSSPQVYNVAIPDERQAIDAVKRVLPVAQIRAFGARLQIAQDASGDVMVGARRREKQKPLQNQA
jgi:hypothetical protein